MPLIEWVAVLLALIYVILAARNSVWCWPFSFVSSCLFAWQVYYAYGLYFDTALNVFYALMALWGLWSWLNASGTNASSEPLKIRSQRWQAHLLWIGSGLVLTLLFWVLAKAYTEAQRPFWDALTSIFSVFATVMLIRRKVENWIYLLVMDLIYVVLYWERGSVLFASLFVLYSILALHGYRSWRKMMRLESWKEPA